jgi:hypothetical protein
VRCLLVEVCYLSPHAAGVQRQVSWVGGPVEAVLVLAAVEAEQADWFGDAHGGSSVPAAGLAWVELVAAVGAPGPFGRRVGWR